jgi:fructose-1,6-bisphosphatase/inositol monophosphatase family enzyme
MVSGDAPLDAIVERMLRFAQEAGCIALERRAAGLAVAHKGAGLGQALTDADLAISDLMRARFGPRLIEEETAAELGHAAAARMLAEPAWTFVGDPVDGTKPYAGGLAGWGTMIAACRDGRPVAGICALPAWAEDRGAVGPAPAPEARRGLLLAAWEGRAHWGALRGGRLVGGLRPLERPGGETFHVGWLANTARAYALDFTMGLFPWCESAAVADAALLATGRLDASVHEHKLWDLAAALPLLEATGFALYRWPDLSPAPRAIIDLFDEEFASRSPWLVCRSPEQAAGLARAMRPLGALP